MGRSPNRGPDLPAWYGHSYPTLEDLEVYAWELGARVQYGMVSKGAYIPENQKYGVPSVLIIPDHESILARVWSLAHEVAHLVLHLGYTSPWTRAKQETQAERWAACALIPNHRIQMHSNASLDAFIGALSAHYEDIPPMACPTRVLAAKIAKIRLHTIQREVA